MYSSEDELSFGDTPKKEGSRDCDRRRQSVRQNIYSRDGGGGGASRSAALDRRLSVGSGGAMGSATGAHVTAAAAVLPATAAVAAAGAIVAPPLRPPEASTPKTLQTLLASRASNDEDDEDEEYDLDGSASEGGNKADGQRSAGKQAHRPSITVDNFTSRSSPAIGVIRGSLDLAADPAMTSARPSKRASTPSSAGSSTSSSVESPIALREVHVPARPSQVPVVAAAASSDLAPMQNSPPQGVSAAADAKPLPAVSVAASASQAGAEEPTEDDEEEYDEEGEEEDWAEEEEEEELLSEEEEDDPVTSTPHGPACSSVRPSLLARAAEPLRKT